MKTKKLKKALNPSTWELIVIAFLWILLRSDQAQEELFFISMVVGLLSFIYALRIVLMISLVWSNRRSQKIDKEGCKILVRLYETANEVKGDFWPAELLDTNAYKDYAKAWDEVDRFMEKNFEDVEAKSKSAK